MRGVNKVIIVGHMGQDPEMRTMPSGSSIATISVATTEGWKDKQTGEAKEQTEWHRIVMFGRLAEIAGEYLRKGSSVYIEGKLRTRKWQDKQGNDRWSTDIIAGEMQMLGGRGAGSAPGDRPASQSAGGGGWPAKGAAGSQPAGYERDSAQSQADHDFDDDIPF